MLAGKLDPYEVVEEHPLMRMKLSYLHERYHLNQLESRPMLVQLVFDHRSIERLSK